MNILNIVWNKLRNNELNKITYADLEKLAYARTPQESFEAAEEITIALNLHDFSTWYVWNDLMERVIMGRMERDFKHAIGDIIYDALRETAKPQTDEEIEAFMKSLDFCYGLRDYIGEDYIKAYREGLIY